MCVSDREKYPYPFHAFSFDARLEKSYQSILFLLIVNSFQIATYHHVEQKQSNQHEELFNGIIPHFESEVFSKVLEELGFSNLGNSAAIDKDEFP